MKLHLPATYTDAEQTVINNVTKTLTDLGDTPDTIRAALATRGITGRRRVDDCPIYNLLKEDGLSIAFVGYQTFTIKTRFAGAWQTTWELLPPPVRDFITNFDELAYPELVTPEETP